MLNFGIFGLFGLFGLVALLEYVSEDTKVTPDGSGSAWIRLPGGKLR